MDIKLGGREMATVVYTNEEDDMCSLVIDRSDFRRCIIFTFP